jgi:hypothetical protein
MSMETPIATTAAGGIVEAIRREHEAATNAARSALDHALECGRLLAEARHDIAHGGWEAFVSQRCGIAPRTARLYLRLDANRDRLGNRQRVAGLTVRAAVRELTVPKVAADSVATTAEPSGSGSNQAATAPEWYRAGHWHTGRHPSGWVFNVWPHPSGDPWVHVVTLDPIYGILPDGNVVAVGPKRGVRIDRVLRIIGMQSLNGMPPLTDDAWSITTSPCDQGAIVEMPTWNPFLFHDQDDYLRRGLGLTLVSDGTPRAAGQVTSRK